MNEKFEKLNNFFDEIKTIGFLQRIFGWRQIRKLSYDAFQEFNDFKKDLENLTSNLEQNRNSIAVLENENKHLESEKNRLDALLSDNQKKIETTGKEIAELQSSAASREENIKSRKNKIDEQEKDLILLKEKVSQFEKEVSQLKKDNTIFIQREEDRKAKYEKDTATLNAITNQIQKDRQKEIEERQKDAIKRLEEMKLTWVNHQDNVEGVIKLICERNTIDYLDKVPFKGNPDNTIKLCDEYVIFDAKSPSSDDLKNFPVYIKAQTEQVKKYIKQENVRRDIFLVIPSNTVDVIESFCYNMADYNVYIVTIDVLEPLILSLKKIEEYEFVDQLSPEERENICRIIGKFAHMTKRRIQIDQFFAWGFLDILTKCKADLPKEILEKVIEFEKSEKLNPPQEKRAKQILNTDLELDNEKIQKEAEAKGIIFPKAMQKSLKELPLYEDEKK